MECDLNDFQRIWYVNSHVDILYSYDVSFAVQYMCIGHKLLYLADAIYDAEVNLSD